MRKKKRKEIRLLQVVNDAFVLPYFIGDQFEYFKKRGVIQFIACHKSEFLDKFAKKVNIPYFNIPIKRSINPFKDLSAILKLFIIIRKYKINYVFGHTPKGAMVAMIAAYLAGVDNRIYFRHGLVFETSNGLKKRVLMFIERLTVKIATKVVNVSPSVLEKVKSEKIDVSKDLILSSGTCNGIDIKRFNNSKSEEVSDLLKKQLKINSDHFIVGFVGRLVRDKGIVELIEAWQILSISHPNMKLLIVGPFEKRDSISESFRRQIKSMDSIIHIDFTEDVVPYYRLMSLLILPSYREGFPTVVLEAGAMGIPAIVTKVTGCIDAVRDHITGLHIENSTEDIIEKIEFYYSHPKILAIHGKQAKDYITTYFPQERIWREIENKLLDS
ncbi:glycosyltransferase family 4 protein [Sphingobacterium anhuiense]|uniref:Glycosyltransferase family 4 protein n=1 Tax=Sphingobacterium anhuiense TaxID=493780 RepID=A0ABW5Z0A6_9SPHI